MAIGFALKNKDPRRVSVLMEIDLKEGTTSGFCFVMNEECYTRFPEENELLLDDGIPFKVEDVTKKANYMSTGITLYEIKLISKLAQNNIKFVKEG